MNGRHFASAASLLALCGCSYAPLTYMRTYGPAADPITSLGWGLTIVCSIVVVVITMLVLIATLRARATRGSMAAIAISRSSNGLLWIYIGTGLSSLVLLGLLIWTMITLAAVADSPKAPSLTIEIRAHQWWWEARYIDPIAADTFVTANELHIPVGTAVRLRLIGDDVIHSFWIPALAGKTDVIPGQTNAAWIEATTAGLYRGQCTEYCGLQHAHMSEAVIAESDAQFQQWRTLQLSDAASPESATSLQGQQVFLSHCAACHTVRGTDAGGILGPDLTHLMGRRTIAAGTLPNNLDSLTRWIANAQAIKPGCQMPAVELSHEDLVAVVAYVQTLD